MKRFCIRLGALTGVVIIGFVAITQAQRSMRPKRPNLDPAKVHEMAIADSVRLTPSAPAGGLASGPTVARVDRPQTQGVNDPFAQGAVNEYPANDAGAVAEDVTSAAGADATYAELPPGTRGAPDVNMQPWPEDGAAQQLPAGGDQYADEDSQPAAAAQQAVYADDGFPGGHDTAAPYDPAAQYAEQGEVDPTESGGGFDSQIAEPSATVQGGRPPRQFNQTPQTVEPIDAAADEPFRHPPTGQADPQFNQQHDPAAAGSPNALHGATPTSSPDQASGPTGTGRPGEQQLEGVQQHAIAIQKIAPTDVQVGRPSVFGIIVRNTGKSTVHDVVLLDQIPQGAELVETSPPAEQDPNGELVWNLGTLRPGEEITVEMHLMPVEEGEIGSVARVQFSAEASVRAVATQPALAIEVESPPQVMNGEEVRLAIKVTNHGSGVARDVVLVDNLPEGLEHSRGPVIEYQVGDLAPNESRPIDLRLIASKPGVAVNVLQATVEGDVLAEREMELEVVAPALKVSMKGPKKRFLEREATYTVSVHNPGTAAAREVQLVTYLPKGMKFVSANNYGEYDPQSRCVRWMLEELPPQESGDVTLVAIPIEPGEQRVVVQGKAEQGLNDEQEQIITVEGVSAILFGVVDLADPIEINGETTYEVRVTNQGTKDATTVRIMALVPETMQMLSADGPSRHAIAGRQVQFEPLAKLPPRSEVVYHVRVKGLAPGDARLRVQLLTDDLQSPVTKEESTRIYADE